MDLESLNLHIVLILTVGFAYASILGYIAFRCGLSTILGYLLAGYLIGPFSPGFEASIDTAEQLAEIGVILMMFGVGLDFKWEDLKIVRRIAIPGAIVQTTLATLAGALLICTMGWTVESGIIIGFAIGVASTVVLVRVLSDNHLLNTIQGHISVGWLIVEDLITVVLLLLVPVIVSFSKPDGTSLLEFFTPILILVLKIGAMAGFMLIVGKRLVALALSKIVKTRSHELFTLTVLALTFLIATGAALLFGTSIALGAFIAGMVIGQTEVRDQAVVHSMHLKDAFLVIFFLSVGMLFNPLVIINHPVIFLGMLSIILILKPLTAWGITILLGYPFSVALTVAIALAQIGEFSFILAEEGMKYNILPDEGFDVLVACALVSIALNPLLMQLAQGREGTTKESP